MNVVDLVILMILVILLVMVNLKILDNLVILVNHLVITWGGRGVNLVNVENQWCF